MTPEDLKVFSEVWGAANEVYGKPQTPHMVRLVFQLFKGMTIEQVKEGIARHMSDPAQGKYPIMPAHVISQTQGTPGVLALEAWSDVEKMITQPPGMRYVVFPDAKTHKIIDSMGGLQLIGRTPYNELQWKQKDFIDRHTNMATPTEYPGRLLLQGTGYMRGYPEFECHYVGNLEECLKIENGGSEYLALEDMTAGLIENVTHD